MRRLVLFGSLLLFACRAHEAQSQKLNDGSWSVTCNLPMEDCIRLVEKTCRSQRYRILQGASETRVRDVPPIETTYYTSRLHLICNPEEEAAPPTATPPATSVAPAPTAEALRSAPCIKGETRECVGSAACRGGQTCLPDQSGFGPCDCGLPAAVAPVLPQAAPEPAPPSTTP